MASPVGFLQVKSPDTELKLVNSGAAADYMVRKLE